MTPDSGVLLGGRIRGVRGSIRREVEDLVNSGPFPSEESGTEDEIWETQRLLERIVRPVSDEEAQELIRAFGSDDCFGLSWALLH